MTRRDESANASCTKLHYTICSMYTVILLYTPTRPSTERIDRHSISIRYTCMLASSLRHSPLIVCECFIGLLRRQMTLFLAGLYRCLYSSVYHCVMFARYACCHANSTWTAACLVLCNRLRRHDVVPRATWWQRKIECYTKRNCSNKMQIPISSNFVVITISVLLFSMVL